MNYSIFIFISPFFTLPWENKCRLVNLGLYSSDLYSPSQILCLRNKNRGTKRNLKQTLIHKECFALRFSGVLVSSLVRPQVMILVSLVSCVMAALLLSLTAATSLALLYTGVGVIGFFISLQFASGHYNNELKIPTVTRSIRIRRRFIFDCFTSFQIKLNHGSPCSGYSWLAAQVDLTGPGSSVVFLGANLGWLVIITINNKHVINDQQNDVFNNKVFPPLAGMVIFSPVGPMGVFYLTLGLSAAHLAVFICLFRLSFI